MPTLHLGVIDIPYANSPKGKGKKKSTQQGKTTGDVAEILEAKYHPMEIFYETHQKQVAGFLTNSLQGALESIMGGAPPGSDPFNAGMGKIETAFKAFLDKEEMAGLGYPGVPTAAALKGVNPRLAHPFAKGNPRRPSFIAMGLYRANFKAWVD